MSPPRSGTSGSRNPGTAKSRSARSAAHPTRRPSSPRRRPPARAPKVRTKRPRRLASPSRRLQAILLLSLFVLSLIAGRLLQLQGLQSAAYAVAANQQRTESIPLQADRGRILDRNGHVLADTVAADDIDATLELIHDKQSTARALAPLLHESSSSIVKALSVPGDYAQLKPQASPQLAQKVMSLNLPGIYTSATTKRIYPDGSLASNVLGSVDFDRNGDAGLEAAYNSVLAGTPGKHVFQVGIDGAPIPDAPSQTIPAQNGATLQLTLQRDIQWDAQQQALAEKKRSDAKGVTVIVENPRNGQLLAVAQAPSFNLNGTSGHTTRELRDAAAENSYEPGSVNKVVTMSAALQDKLVTPDSRFVIPPEIEQGGTWFHDAEPHGYEHLTLTGILAQSSNIGTIEVARKLGARRLDQYLKAYGYGRSTDSGLPGESPGTLLPLKDWSATTMPTVAFGQGIGVTALQVAAIYSTIANGGVRIQPSLLESTTEPDGRVIAAPAAPRKRIISEHTAHQLSDMLEAVTTEEGTAPEAQIPGYRVAGKTGTAEIPLKHSAGYSNGYTGSFVGFAPADKPRLVVEVVVNDPRKGSHFGADVAAPVFKNVMSFALQTLHIPPTGTKPPKAKITW